jgi:hypothetical protein
MASSPGKGEAHPAPNGPVRAVRRILISCAWFGGLVLVALWVFAGGPWALGFAGGALIGTANLVLLALLVREIIRPGRRNAGRIAALLAIKIPLVYGGLAALILWKLPPTLAIVSGFSLILIIIILRAAGRALVESGLLGGVEQD